MSASLVGSEMCIRDSLVSLQTTPQATRVTSQVNRGKMGNSKGVVAPLAPVSYTHLTLPTICSV
eukprot:5971755-Alexandrium_andersonii.AAC.1